MENYKHSAKAGQKIILNYLKNRMEEKKITQNKLCKILNIDKTTLIKYFKQEKEMPVIIFLEICGILKLRPYLVPAEIDKTDMHRVYFN